MRQAYAMCRPLSWDYTGHTRMGGEVLRWERTRYRAAALRYTESHSAVSRHLGNLMLGRPMALSSSQYTTVSVSLFSAEPSTRSTGGYE